ADGRRRVIDDDRRAVGGRRLREVAAQLFLGRHRSRGWKGDVFVEALIASHEERLALADRSAEHPLRVVILVPLVRDVVADVLNLIRIEPRAAMEEDARTSEL